ncbi:MAG TPA: transglycosylase SLT domain-containing protein [Gemmatimonadaceae bacterium]|nr:transglycosylase SLT domain-containing protein [Gemmatimonadaceae bacterium]
MAVAALLCVAAVIISSAGCSDGDTQAHPAVAYVGTDSIPHVVDSVDRDRVLRARAFDRADKLDSARILYEEAAKNLRPIQDWLYLRAAGVTTDASDRQKYFRDLKTEVAKNRREPTEAIALERSGKIPDAIRAYRAAGLNLDALRLEASPPSDSATRAGARGKLISYLAQGAGRESARDGVALFDKLFPVATPSEQLTLARAAYGVGLAARSVAGYTTAFRARLGTARDHFNDGLMLARLNRDKEAAAQFALVSEPSSLVAAARYQRARALLASGSGTDARNSLRAITTVFPSDTSAASALVLLSDLATDEGRDADARSTLLTVVKRYPKFRHASTALFRSGIIAYVQGNYGAAASELDSLAELYPSSDDGLAAMYWGGRAWQQRGDTAKARAHWRAVMAKDPSSYYSVVSSRRLGVPLLKDSSRTDNYPTVRDVSDAAQRIDMLEDLGMDAEAKFEYDRLFEDANKSPERLVATTHALAGGEQSNRAITLGRKVVTDLGPTPQNFRLLYPVSQREQLAASAKANGLDPALVAGLIKQESSFNPRAVSLAGARGLMQVMPSVGAEIARSRGITNFSAERLFDPSINIQLGTVHLRGLFRSGRDVAYILAAYNAGETRLTRWLRKPGASDPELFAERIPYVETRDYVRAVIRNRAFYRVLYNW